MAHRARRHTVAQLIKRTLLSTVQVRNAAASRKHRGNPVSQALSVSASRAGLHVSATFSCPPPSVLVLADSDSVVAGIPVARGDRITAFVGDVQIASAFAAAMTRRTERGGPAPTPEAEAPEQPPGATLRIGWAWDVTDVGVPRWCTSLEIADGTLMSRKTWREYSEAATDAGTTVPPIRRGIRWVGQAMKTRVEPAEPVLLGAHTVRPYVNRRGNISLSVDRPLKPSVTAWADSIDMDGCAVQVRGRLATRHDRIDSADFVWRARTTDTEFREPVRLTLDMRWTSNDRGRAHYDYEVSTGVPQHRWEDIDAGDNYDAYLEVRLRSQNEPTRVRVNKVPLATRLATTPGTFTARDGRVLSVSPYFTFKAKALSAKFEVFAPDVHAAMMGAVPAASSSRPVWIIGELPYKAQDNGMHFYNWMRRHHPEIDAYYVIDADSPERRNLEDESHVVDFGSRRHVVLALQAQRFIGSHHPDFLYPTRNAHFVRRLTGARVFLQHGVMGTKWMVPNYGKNSPGFETDLFLASSEHEKSYLVHDFGYSPQEVVVTGLPRFDRLLAHNDLKNPRRVIVMPTWRDWLQSDDESFLDSTYYAAWKGFLSSESFAETVRAHDLDVVLCLHPNMQRFSGHFAEIPARIVAQGEENVQDLLMGAACMITDYSSVGFDFSFQHRPVLYYQFDRPAFLGRNGSHLDLDSELPGLVRQDEESALRAFAALADHDFVQDEELRGRADRFLDHRDTASNERVFRAVATAERKRSHTPGELAGVPTAAFRRFRKHRFYYPLMKNMSRLLRLLPVKQDVLVFESGLGKQYADSPRYIYEELIRRGDTRTKVWIHSGSMRPRDPETKIVKRLSPSYYYYVARAAFITTNQNLPFYLKRHRRATYVQTWHGTPLKRMQHDMVDQSGHRDDYLRRVEAATSQWTHLLSPSPYATRAFRSAFRYDGPVVEEGYPRNDPLLAPDAEQVGAAARRRLGIAPDAKVVLYAPTFRDRQTSAAGRYSFELPFDLEETMAALPDDVVLLLRMHVLVGSKIDIPGHLRDRVKNVSEYPEIQELYLASDVLVTDYSSVFFDDALLRRPIIFHAYDLEEYRDQDRGFYLDYEKDLPGPISRTQEELVKEIMSALEEPVDQQRRQEFLDRFAPKDDGHAAQRVVDRLYSSVPGTPALTALRSRVAGLLARTRR